MKLDMVGVAQVVRVLGCEPRGHGFYPNVFNLPVEVLLRDYPEVVRMMPDFEGDAAERMMERLEQTRRGDDAN